MFAVYIYVPVVAYCFELDRQNYFSIQILFTNNKHRSSHIVPYVDRAHLPYQMIIKSIIRVETISARALIAVNIQNHNITLLLMRYVNIGALQQIYQVCYTRSHNNQ